MMRANLITTLVGVTALCVATTSAADPCPSNVICVAGQPCESMTAVSGAREAIFNGGVSAYAVYDWSAASCGAITQLPFNSPTPIEGRVDANEDFVVTGIPPGTPLSIRARIRVIANVNSPGGIAPSNHAAGWLEKAGAGRVETVASSESVGPPVDIDQVLPLDFPNLAGETFRLTMGARSDSREGTSRVGVTLSFVDLPPGAILSSCHSSGTPVPTRPVSWGSFKSQYR
jgi:hypothetical protein